MKNILILTNSLNGGGAEKVLRDLLRYIDKSKYNVDIALINKEGIYLEEIENKHDVKEIVKNYSDIDGNLFIRMYKLLRRKLKLYLISSNNKIIDKIIPDKYDIEIAFLEGFSTKIISKRKNLAKKIAWVHIDLKKHRTLTRKCEFKAYNKMDKIICVSNDSANSFKDLYPDFSHKVEVIYNPIDVNKVKELSKVSENEILKKNGLVNFITIGRLSYQKGYDILLKVHKELIQEGIDHNIYILGEGKEREYLEKYIKSETLDNTVKLLGFKKNPYPYIVSADVFVCSSRYEGFSLALAECLLLGKPIISTECAGPKELLNNGEYGVLVKAENIEGLKNAMKEMILDKKMREFYTNKSLERSKIFNINKTINEVENLIDSV